MLSADELNITISRLSERLSATQRHKTIDGRRLF